MNDQPGGVAKNINSLADFDPRQLLLEWFKLWEADDNAPATLPNSLHVRTSCYLVIELLESGADPLGVLRGGDPSPWR